MRRVGHEIDAVDNGNECEWLDAGENGSIDRYTPPAHHLDTLT